MTPIPVTDADHSDACSEKQAVEMVDGVEAAVVHDAGVGGAVVTEQMIEEEKKLQQQCLTEQQLQKLYLLEKQHQHRKQKTFHSACCFHG